MLAHAHRNALSESSAQANRGSRGRWARHGERRHYWLCHVPAADSSSEDNPRPPRVLPLGNAIASSVSCMCGSRCCSGRGRHEDGTAFARHVGAPRRAPPARMAAFAPEHRRTRPRGPSVLACISRVFEEQRRPRLGNPVVSVLMTAEPLCSPTRFCLSGLTGDLGGPVLAPSASGVRRACDSDARSGGAGADAMYRHSRTPALERRMGETYARWSGLRRLSSVWYQSVCWGNSLMRLVQKIKGPRVPSIRPVRCPLHHRWSICYGMMQMCAA